LTLEIRDCTFRDLHLVVGIHEKAFGGFFMSQLGSDFLFRYYKTIYCYDKPLFKVATLESNIIGLPLVLCRLQTSIVFLARTNYTLV